MILRNRILLAMALAVCVLFSAFIFYVVADQRAKDRAGLDEKGERLVELLAHINAPDLWTLDRQKVRLNCELFFKDQDLVAIEIWDSDGERLVALQRPGERDTLGKGRPILFDGQSIGRVELRITARHLEARLERLRNRLAVAGIVLVLMLLAAVLLLLRAITRPLERILEVLDAVSRRDLGARVGLKTKGPSGLLAASFDGFLDELGRRLRDIQTQASTIGHSVDQLDTMAGEIARRSVRDRRSAEDASGALNQASANLVDNVQKATRVREVAQAATGSLAEGRANVEQAVERLRAIKQIVASHASAVGVLGERAAQIEKQTAAIETLAKNTNTLAINAGLEAARAGDLGKGFAIVAGELRRHASTTQATTRAIDVSLRAITAEVRSIVQRMGEVDLEVEAGVRSVESNRQEFDRMTTDLEQVRQLAVDSSTSLQQQVDATQNAAARTSELTQSTRLTDQSVASLSEIVSRLSETATVLSASAEAFKLGSTDTTDQGESRQCARLESD